MSHQEFENDKTLKRFLLICERLIHKWQQNYYLTDWRSSKRELNEPPGDKKNNKKSKGHDCAQCDSRGSLLWLW